MGVEELHFWLLKALFVAESAAFHVLFFQNSYQIMLCVTLAFGSATAMYTPLNEHRTDRGPCKAKSPVARML